MKLRSGVFKQDIAMFGTRSFYTVKLAFGSQQEEMTLLLDTGSSWTWVTGSTCERVAAEEDFVFIQVVDESGGWTGGPQGFYVKDLGSQCSAVPFEYENSTTFRKSSKTKFIQYGKGAVEGHISRDTLWVDTSGCKAHNMQFLAVDKLYDKTLGTDGILGMCPVDESSGPLLMTALNA